MLNTHSPTKVGWTIPEWCADTGIGRSKTYELIAEGAIETRKCGKRTLVVTTPAAFIASLPPTRSR